MANDPPDAGEPERPSTDPETDPERSARTPADRDEPAVQRDDDPSPDRGGKRYEPL